MSEFLSFRLSDSFVEQYANKSIPWGFNIHEGLSLGELTYISKYSRIKDDGTKERWHETCRRVVEGMFSIQKDWCRGQRTPWNDHKAQKAAQDAYDRMFNFKWTPPGRGMWAMGTEMTVGNSNSAPLYNCFDGETLALTTRGWKTLRSLSGTTPTLLSRGGKWIEAPVSSFGAEELWEVTVKRAGETLSFLTTENHRWFVKGKQESGGSSADYREVSTRDLRPAHVLQEVYEQGVNSTSEESWTVVNVECTGRRAEVFCATVPDEAAFVIEGNILTGNCAWISTEKITSHSKYEATLPFVRLMDMSMNGIGVGFDTKGAGNITLHEPSGEPEVFVVPDTREGWADSVGHLLVTFFLAGQKPVEFDYSLVRPAGAPLKTFGGTASGPGPLQSLHESVRRLLSDREGEPLTSRDIVDIQNLIGKAVVAGGARRSAELALGSPDDEDYINLKNWNLPENAERTGPDGWSWNSNNSVAAEVSTDLSHIIESNIVNGEPGIVWLDVARSRGRLADPPDNKDYRVTGVNPCVTGDTWVLTSNGARKVVDLLDSPFTAVVDGQEYASPTGFWKTGEKDVFKVVFTDGRELRLTDNHQLLRADGQWVELADLEAGDAIKVHRHGSYSWDGPGSESEGYMLGHLIGDGTFDDARAYLACWPDHDNGSGAVMATLLEDVEALGVGPTFKGWVKTSNQYRLGTAGLTNLADKFGVFRGNKTITDKIEEGSSDFTAGVLAGLFDTDGSIQGTQTKGVSVRLTSIDRDMLGAAQRMLGRLGINSTIYFRRETSEVLLPDGRGGSALYQRQPLWELIVSRENLSVFADRIPMRNPVKAAKLRDRLAAYNRPLHRDSFESVIAAIDPDGTEEVYDATVEGVHAFDANGLWAHNCAEIPLESHELCCVSGETRIQTKTGAPRIEDVVDQEVEVWNGESWSKVRPFLAAHNKALYRVTLSDGSQLDVTDNHEWSAKRPTERSFKKLSTLELEPGMDLPNFALEFKSIGEHFEHAYLRGFLAGDGFMDGDQALALVQEPESEVLLPALAGVERAWQHPEGYSHPFTRVNVSEYISSEEGRRLRNSSEGLPDEVFQWDADSVADFMAGWIDADGSVRRNPRSQHLILHGSEKKLRDAQILLRRCGVNAASVHLEAPAGAITNKGRRTRDLYALRIPAHECAMIPTKLKVVENRPDVGSMENNAHPDGRPISLIRKQKVVSVELVDVGRDTFCFTEPVKHMGVFGNALTYQCLAETYINNAEGMDDWLATCKVAMLYAKTVTLLPTPWAETNEVIVRNRRIGVSTTGTAEFVEKQGWDTLKNYLSEGYEYLKEKDTQYSEWLGVRQSIRLTTSKPAGSTSLLAGTSPGVHWPTNAGVFLRRMRFHRNDPLVSILEKSKFLVEPDLNDPNWTVVAEFPVDGLDMRSEHEVSIWEKAELAAFVQMWWADNAVSVTVTFSKDEADQIYPLLRSKAGQFKTISFLPPQDEGGYAQAPFEVLSAEEAERIRKGLRKVNLKAVYDSGKTADASDSRFCDTEACEIDLSG